MQTFQNNRSFLTHAFCGISSIESIFKQLSVSATTATPNILLYLSADDTPTEQLLAQLRQQLTQLPSNLSAEWGQLTNALQQMTSMALSNGQRFVCQHFYVEIHGHLSQTQLAQQVFNQPFIDRWHLDSSASALTQNCIWRMAAMTTRNARVELSKADAVLSHRLMTAGLQLMQTEQPRTTDDTIAASERAALCHQQQQQRLPFPVYVAPAATSAHTAIAIIGAGVAGSQLALALANKGQASKLFCAEAAAGEAASGNRQGALYPLLTPESSVQNDFFVQGYEFSRAQIAALAQAEPTLAFDFCGVLQTGFDDRSRQRLDKIFAGQPWPVELLTQIDSATASAIAGIELKEQALYYPLAGWVCPQQLCQATVRQAEQTGLCEFTPNCHIERIEQVSDGWLLHSAAQSFGPFKQLVLANGAGITLLPQTAQLPISPFRGQVSEINSTTELSALKTVLCAKGYLTPQWQQQHCLGATYLKGDRSIDIRASEQQDNLDKLRLSYPGHSWVDTIEMGTAARAGVRMVTRDHLPMVGAAPDAAAIFAKADELGPTPESIEHWQNTAAPVLDGLYLLAGLGSRGICSGPLAAEILACELLGLPMPVNQAVLEALNPNRMWMRKLLKGRALNS
ncbi:FAD-dependent 5-carboxymethylaminomethyl-2-thiouridine(34) oxidoreductase MnmC [Shewanella sp. A3A]|nr:FAD-dependent 5-carboxymethylaminomethyl-2-thiouridine(34) oxidoreductase MnmC [Shewanella ferrihydritica]